MKKLSIIFLLLLFSEGFSQNGVSTSQSCDIQGDTTLTVIMDLWDRIGNDELFVLVDSLNGSGTFNSTSGLTIIQRPRIGVRYQVTDESTDLTYYTSLNDSSIILNSWTDSLSVGLQNFEADSLALSSRVQYEFDFSAGDTMRIILIHTYEKKH